MKGINKVALYGTLAVVLVTLVGIPHGISHDGAQVSLAAWQWAYVVMVVSIAPILAAILLWTRFHAAGVWLLLASMSGSLVFGLIYHFLVPGPDNVFTPHAGAWQTPFLVTAVLVALTNAFGVGVGVWALNQLSQAGGEKFAARLGGSS